MCGLAKLPVPNSGYFALWQSWVKFHHNNSSATTFNDMKPFSCFARFAGCQSTQPGVFCLALVLGAAMFAAGCGKSKPSTTETPAPAATNNTQSAETNQGSAYTPPEPPAAPAEVSAAPTVAPPAAPDMGALQRGLARWLVRNRRVPANFEDFAATSGMTIPPPPPGKKYYIVPKTMQIKLVDR